jgi:phosphoribosylglycinamide formyltransferase 2
VELETTGLRVIPTARAAWLTMDREGIRRLAAEELGLPTSPYRFVDTRADYRAAIADIGLPCVVKPVMSSSGKGQSTVRSEADIDAAWDYAQSGGRAGQGRVIVEGFVRFDYEITLLTVRHAGGTEFCDPIGHLQIDGDYRESWQPQPMRPLACSVHARSRVRSPTNLGGYGLFGVELFVAEDEVWFSEVSATPARHRPGHPDLAGAQSEFALHARAILGLPIPVSAPVRPLGLLRPARPWPWRATRAGHGRSTARTGNRAAPVRQAAGRGTSPHRRDPGTCRKHRGRPRQGTRRCGRADHLTRLTPPKAPP